ncbi:hypothetical protein [Microbacterium sp. 69-10]|uniref:hypothetical protein n=1 Tax=Microbacterium sp. 69-10 TaxID=1895783 RepID=UPI0025D49927|nr:hypothetical protein [Microbacterium sp. 69-10]
MTGFRFISTWTADGCVGSAVAYWSLSLGQPVNVRVLYSASCGWVPIGMAGTSSTKILWILLSASVRAASSDAWAYCLSRAVASGLS